MKEINIKLYSFEELSKDAKAMICNKERESVYNYGTMAMESDSDERVATLNAFCKLFGITYRIDYDHSRRFISWQFQNVEMNGYEWNDEDISGKYLLRFLNRYYYDIRQREYQYKSKSGKTRKSKIGWYVGG